MSLPTAVIAEEEPLLRAELRETLSKLWPELVICAEAADGFEALQALQQHSPQVMFLDIQMPGLNGLEGGRSPFTRTSHGRQLPASSDQLCVI
jgi:DNA-binding LytR/AlgR family response regulator